MSYSSGSLISRSTTSPYISLTAADKALAGVRTDVTAGPVVPGARLRLPGVGAAHDIRVCRRSMGTDRDVSTGRLG